LFVFFLSGKKPTGVKVEIAESAKQGRLLRNHLTATEEEKEKVFTVNIVYKEVLL
jgi:hypothetical protein